MITRLAPRAKGTVLPLPPLSANRTVYIAFANTFPNVGFGVTLSSRNALVSTGRYGLTSARYTRIVLLPIEDPLQPPELQEVGAFGFKPAPPSIGYPLKNPCSPANADCPPSTVAQ